MKLSPNRCDPAKAKKWDPPPGGWALVNVDATIFLKDNRMGVGIVIKDHRGDFLAACRQGIKKVSCPQMAKALALRRAIQFASELHYDQAMVATDCLSLIQKL
jgi:hypothetical protein